MNRKLFQIVFLTIASTAILAGCENSDEMPANTIERPDMKRIVLSTEQSRNIEFNNRLAFNLLNARITGPQHSEESNTVFSPISVYVLLSMLSNGDDGEAAREIIQALAGNSSTSVQELNTLNSILIEELPKVDPTTTLTLGNALWFNKDYTCTQEFKSILSNVYGGEYHDTDFSDRISLKKQINDWVETNTAGGVKDFLEDTHLINQTHYLVNAVYFKGIWREKFPKDKSQKAVFHTTNGDETVTMMHLKESFSFYEDNLMESISIPYGSGNFAMRIILPSKSNDVINLVSILNTEYYEEILSKMQRYDVDLALPKFSVQSKLELEERDFLDTGINRLFSDGLSGICEESPIVVQKLLTHTYVCVDETGTEAAAASTVLGYTDSNPFTREAVMTVDRPFIFVIEEVSTKAIVCMGCIENI